MTGSPPGNTRIFEHRSVIPTTTQQMMDFHDHPQALRRLTPPPIIMQQLKDTRQSLTEGELAFRLWFGPIPIRWLARHEPGPIDTSFADRMLDGPMAYWRHEHIFQAVDDGVELTDRITLAHRPGVKGLLTRVIFGGPMLRFLFLYRHWQTRRILRGSESESGNQI
jgi:ligand-binding SRPBCC domain-containing protein